jgi:hypothetical protein
MRSGAMVLQPDKMTNSIGALSYAATFIESSGRMSFWPFCEYCVQFIKVLLLLLPFTRPNSILSITGRDQTGYTVHAGFCMFPQSCDLRTETAGSL